VTYASHDWALQELQGTAPELRNGAPNHAPMVIEALAVLERDDAVARWIEHARPRLAEGPKTRTVLAVGWQPALGDMTRLGEWQNLFRSELQTSSWREVLERWLPRLIPGSMAAGTHGVIRCGHASRALENQVTAPRLGELSAALAYCAARYRKLGGAPVLAGPLGLRAAVHELPLLNSGIDRQGPPPRIVERLDEHPDFAWAVSRLAPPANVVSALSDLAEVGARLYLHNADHHPLVLLHAVTGPAAMQLLMRHTSADLGRTAFAYTWQAVAAWAAAFGSGLSDIEIEGTDESWDAIIDLSVESGDEHAIKLTEACRRMDGLRPSPAFRAAASDWVNRVVEAREWSAERLVDAGIRTRLSDD